MRALVLGLVVGLGLAIGLGGCGSSDGPVDPAYGPEGKYAQALLIVHAAPANPETTAVDIIATVYDPTVATGFRAYNRIGAQGFVPATAYLASATQVFSTGWEVYRMPIQVFAAGARNDFIARGATNGLESEAAPLTEIAVVPAASALELARRIPVAQVTPDSVDSDSTPVLTWVPTSGAAQYLLSVRGRKGIVYLATTTQTVHEVAVTPATVIENIPLRIGSIYQWSILALDADNRVIGASGERDIIVSMH